MSPKDFKNEFGLLVRKALTEQPAPIHQMIVEFEIAKATCISILSQIESQKSAQELAHKILPANGKLPEIRFEN